MFNPIICPVRNNLHLTRKAIKTFKAQDIGDVQIIVINNASTDGTNEYLQTQRDVMTMYFNPPLSVAESWNRALSFVFKAGAEYALVVNNDVELRPDTYRHLVNDGGGFVTAVGTRDHSKIMPTRFLGDNELVFDTSKPNGYGVPNPEAKRPHPDFSCYLIRREVYEKVGGFDEHFLIAFGEDWDYHIRMHRAGITAYCLDLPFLHHGSMTIKSAELVEVRRIQQQAEKNREYFKKKWGVVGASKEYYDLFGTGAPLEEESPVPGQAFSQ